jgi:hypothetical protein
MKKIFGEILNFILLQGIYELNLILFFKVKTSRILFIFTIRILSVYCEDCPNPQIFKPCECISSNIYCSGNETLQLKDIFHRMSIGLDKDKKHFKEFYLDNTAINELPENTFEDITFDSIKIQNAKNLSLIHTLAFSASNLYLKRFFVSNSSIKNSPPNHNIFTAISSMVGLEYLFIINSLIDEIPENAFRLSKDQQKNLSEIYLFSNKIRKVGDNAFQDLISLKELDLHNNTIDHISGKSFNFRESSEKITRIFLNGCLLNSSSFEIGAFDNLNRPTELGFNLYDQINYVTYFDERIFEPFLDKNKNNQIISKALDCNDCRSFWLHKNEKYHPQIQDSACMDGKKFLDKVNFAKCAEY